MKKKLLTIVIIVSIALSMQFCGSGGTFTTPAFYEKSGGHRTIAVVPFEMIFTGNKPKKLTVERARKLEEMESLDFQRSLYKMLMQESIIRRHPIRIAIQPIKKTNRLLEERNISIRESWKLDSRELAEILHVDAVVRTRIIKKRYMSAGASFGIELGTTLLDLLLSPEDETPCIFRGVRAPSNDIKAECIIVNAIDGDILWHVEIQDDTDWKRKPNTIIRNINYYFTKKFPYR